LLRDREQPLNERRPVLDWPDVGPRITADFPDTIAALIERAKPGASGPPGRMSH
jgi:hypothetical protein